MLILFTGVILVSAFDRLHLYELTYGLTTLRLGIYVFIGWLGFTFAGFVLSLYWKRPRLNVFSLTVLIATFGFVATLDVVNPDSFVAWQSIQRGDIDALYLSQLSEEAVPALVTLIDSPEPGVRSIVRYTLFTMRRQINPFETDWRDFNLDRGNALDTLNNLQDWLADASWPSWNHPI
jgi:hypothetical protein